MLLGETFAREGTSLKHIDSLTSNGQEHGQIDRRVVSAISKWLNKRKNLKGAIWTGLSTNWPNKRDGQQFTCEDAVAYVRELEAERDQTKAAYNRAHEYICNAPSQIQTPVRRMMREKKGWEDANLAAILFE